MPHRGCDCDTGLGLASQSCEAVHVRLPCISHRGRPRPRHGRGPSRAAGPVPGGRDGPRRRARFAGLRAHRGARGARERRCCWRIRPPMSMRLLERARPAAGEFVRLDADTVMNERHLAGRAARRAAAPAWRSTWSWAARPTMPSWRCGRPATTPNAPTAMGFCFFNHAAIAARHAQAAHGVERVAIVDFDVHHGNGTQDIFWDDPIGPVLLDAPDAALSGHRRRERTRRARHDRQRAARGPATAARRSAPPSRPSSCRGSRPSRPIS